MKLALIIDDYLPHSTRVGAKMFHELGLELLGKGHEDYQVLASGANYFNEKEIVGELSRKIARQRTEGSEK